MSAQILGVGSCLPTLRMTNQDFIAHRFYKGIDQPFEDSNEIIIEKFKESLALALKAKEIFIKNKDSPNRLKDFS